MYRAIDNLNSKEEKSFYIQQANDYVAVSTRNILFFESKLRKVRVVTDTAEYEYYDRLDEVEKKINNLGESFIRIHQSYLVNSMRIAEIDGYQLMIDNGKVLPISKARYQTTRMEYAKYITSD